MNVLPQAFEDVFETSERVQVKYGFNIHGILNNNAAYDLLLSQRQPTLSIVPFVEYRANGQLHLQFTIIDSENSSNSTIISAQISANQKQIHENSQGDFSCIPVTQEYGLSDSCSTSSEIVEAHTDMLNKESIKTEMFCWETQNPMNYVSKKVQKSNEKQYQKLTNSSGNSQQKQSFQPYKLRKISETPSTSTKEEYSILTIHNQAQQNDHSTSDNNETQPDLDTHSIDKARFEFSTNKRLLLNTPQTVVNSSPLHEQFQELNKSVKDASKADEDPNKKGNAVNMAKNILKGFMEYMFASAKETDIVDCCSKAPRPAMITAEEDMCGENEDESNQNIEQVIEEDHIENQKSADSLSISEQVETIRKRFRKQYNSKILEKPSNSKLLKFFANANYGRLFAHYFSSEEILRYISSSNIQNKQAHVELINKIRSTDYDIEKLQEVLKTRIFKRPPFQKPSK